MARTVRGGILLGLAAGVACMLVFGVYARACVDLDALRDAHAARFLDDAFAGKVDLDGYQQRMLHFHKGTPPCASYGPKVTPSDQELAAIERDLRGANLLVRVRESSSLFYKWGRADEERRHGPRTDEELLAAWNETATPYERAIAFFAGAALAAKIRAGSRAAEERELARADEQEKKLTHHEMESLQGIWLRHPTAMSFPTLVQTLSKLPRDESPQE
jgi:hypothetical protein